MVVLFQLTVKQDLFITMDLPKAIVRGEEILMQITAFNFLTQEVNVRNIHLFDLRFKKLSYIY